MKHLIILASALTLSMSAFSQTDTTYNCQKGSYLSFGVGGGLHSLGYKLSDYGNKTLSGGISANLGYSYYFTPHFGFGFGAQLQTFSSTAKLNYIEEINGAIDDDNEEYTHRTYYNDLKENQKQTQLAIPVELFYQTQLSTKLKLNLGLGIMPELVMSESFKTKSGDLETRAYYSDLNLELYGLEHHHQYKASDFSGNYDYKTSIAGIFNAQLLYALNSNVDLLFGIYTSYSFNSQTSPENQKQYDPDCMSSSAYTSPIYNGVLNSEVTSKVNPFTLGGQIGLRFRFKHKEKSKPEEPITEKVEEKVEETQPEQQVVETQPVEQVEEQPKQPEPQVVEKVEEQVEEQPKQPEPQPVEKVEEQVVETDTAMVVPNISFGRGFTESNLDKQAKEALDSIANLMKSNPNLKLELIGHTDSTGTEEVNIRVGKQRAENIKQMLVKRGVKSSRIKCFTKGETEPLVPNNSEENMAKNRRVEMIFKD